MKVRNQMLSLLALFRKHWRALLAIVLANVVYAFAVSYFTLPYHFPDLGVAGIAVLTNYLFGISPGWILVVGNLMLLLWGRKELSPRFLVLTCTSIFVLTVFLPIFERIPLNLTEDRFMATVITGFLKGISVGVMFNVGGSSGGFDIVAMVMRRRHGLEVGRFSIFINSVILALSLGVVGLDNVVYGVVGVYIYGVMLDNMGRSFDRRKQALIITSSPDEVAHFIAAMGKGVTRLEGSGAYTGQPRPVLLSLLEPRQVVQLKHYLSENDPNAFVSICDASEVLGRGFKSWRSL